MLKDIELQNFGIHEALKLDFVEGLTALRGANEAGKSTIYRAVMYAFVGSRSLPLSLEETVTRGKPISSLKVKLRWGHNGITYLITRSKAGAELTAEGSNLRVSGQSEVTKYVENLLNANADVLSKISVASQNAIRGALEGNQAVSLIEKLAGVGLIDDLISGIQEKLPSGSTKLMEARHADMLALPAPGVDLGPLKLELASAQAVLEVAATGSVAAQAAAAAAEALEDGARAAVAVEQAAVAARENMRREIFTLELQLSKVVEKPLDQTAIWEAAEQKQSGEAKLHRAYVEFSKYKPATGFLPPGFDAVAAETAAREAQHKATAKLQTARTEIQVQKAMLITQTACGLCGKDLTEVPEVVVKNAEVQTKIAAAEATVAEALLETQSLASDLADLAEVREMNAKAELVYAKLSEFTELDLSTVPSVVKWTADMPGEPDTTNYQVLLQGYRTAFSKYQTAEATRQAAQTRMAEAQAWWAANGAAKDVSEHLAVLEAGNQARAEHRTAERAAAAAQRAVDVAQLNLKSRTDYLGQLIAAYEANKVAAEALKAEIAEVAANNELIKVLREARPAIAAKLWSVVLAAISRYFSEIRGVASTVTVREGKFLVDGYPAEAVSGSTLDALGLAMRVALGKTFLPSIDFLMLDEPASGMDDERETAMLGLLASIGYPQVVVVTHSTLADSYAASVLTV